jgi:ketosteroid isomerase-like protein
MRMRVHARNRYTLLHTKSDVSRNKAKGFDIRNLRVVISKTGDVVWFSAVVDDEGEFDREPWGAKDIRWTGVLEKRGGSWKICQQHMSEGKR